MKKNKIGTIQVHQITINKGEDLNKAINKWLDLQPEGVEIIKNEVFELSNQIILIMTYKTNLIDLYMWIDFCTTINLNEVDYIELEQFDEDGLDNRLVFILKNDKRMISSMNIAYKYSIAKTTLKNMNKILAKYREGEITNKNIQEYLNDYNITRNQGFGSLQKEFDSNYMSNRIKVYGY